MNVTSLVSRHARERPEALAILDGERRLTYGQLDEAMRRAAARLVAEGVTPGQLVAIRLPESLDFAVVLLALARIGALSTGIALSTPASEISEEMAFVGARRLVHDGSCTARVGEAGILLEKILAPGSFVDFEDPGGSAAMMLVSTSGTTRTPKNLLLTHQQMVWRTETTARLFGPHPTDRVLVMPALQTAWGRRGFFFDVMRGATAVIHQAASGSALIDIMKKQSITFSLASPVHLRAMMRAVKGSAPLLPDLRLVVSSAALSPQERRLIRRWLTPNLYYAYGTNEVGYVSVAGPEDQDRRPASVGRCIEGVRLSIVDPDGREVPAGTVGEIRIQAPESPSRYEGDPDATGKLFRDGWFHPGDLGMLDAAGYLFLKGRTDDVINSSGIKFYPGEVEEILLEAPAVTEVAVIPWPDPRTGECALAFVVPGPGFENEKLLDFCRSRMPAYRIPAHIIKATSLPRNAMGKVMKGALKERAARILADQRK